MNYDLNNNEELIKFFNDIFKDQSLTQYAPYIMKFFIITRNYGLIDYQNNINKICNGDNFKDLCIDIIKHGFKKDNIPYDNDNLLSLLIKNYHANGFYYHSFPGIYKENIEKQGILASNREELDDKYYEIVDKYHFGDYFRKPDNRVCVTEKIGHHTYEYAIFTPEWLEMFLKQGNHDIHDAYLKGDVDEMQEIADNALLFFRTGMLRNPAYDTKDCDFLSHYIKDVVNKRFANGNNEVCIALIEKSKSDEYFKKHIKEEDQNDFINFAKSQKMDDEHIFDFIIESLSNGQITTDKSIPSDLVNIVSYQVNTNTFEENRQKK